MHPLFTYKKADNNKKDRRRTLYVMISDDIPLKQREKEHCSIYLTCTDILEKYLVLYYACSLLLL